MLVIDGVPSGCVLMLALSREPGTTAPACERPSTGSFPRAPKPKFDCWAFHVTSVKPRLYDQSCMRLCMTNRFAVAALMSFVTPGVASWAGSQPLSNQMFVHGY
jgi:hypothetical protein